MRNLLSVVGFVGLTWVVVACGKEDRNPNIGGGAAPSGGKGLAPAAGKSNTGDGGAGSEMVDPLAPIVTITAPKAVTDPNQDDVLIGTEVEVICTATQSPEKNSEKVDGTTVKLELLDAERNVVEEKPGNPTENDDEYSNTFNLVPIATGALAFRCTAKDLGGEHVGEDEIASLVDKGPVITFIEPEEDGGFHPLEEVLAADFTVEAASLGKDDEGATIGAVSLDAVGVAIDLTDAEIGPGSYHVELDLTDGTLFTPPPNGPFSLTVTATNSRSPAPVTAVQTRNLSIDGDGPTITITAPGNKTVVGNDVYLSFDVKDSVSGADPESVVVTLNDDPRKYGVGDWNLAGTVFTYHFTSLDVPEAKIQITVNITATDKVGNASKGASTLLYVDHIAPFIDMDPLNIRAANDDNECSISFDPLGDAVSDLQKLGEVGTFRTIVWETTNTLEGSVGYLAETKKDTVTLYVRHEDDGPLVEDTTGDGICDDVVNREDAAFVKLMAVPVDGDPSWGPGGPAQPTTASLSCAPRAVESLAPKIDCDGIKSDMTYVINHDTAPDEEVVWSVDVGLGTCTGQGWDISTKLASDGWVCVTTRVEDNAGNFGVAPPLRVCVDDPDVQGTPACDTAEAPSCTKSCTPPQHWGDLRVSAD